MAGRHTENPRLAPIHRASYINCASLRLRAEFVPNDESERKQLVYRFGADVIHLKNKGRQFVSHVFHEVLYPLSLTR